MLPHKHFLIAGLVISPVAIIFYPEKPIIEIGKWILMGGLISSAIDLDIFALTFLKSNEEDRLKPFRNITRIYKEYDLFMNTIAETGVRRIGMRTHIIISMLVILLFYLFLNAYFIPVVLGVASHIITDIPNFQRVG